MRHVTALVPICCAWLLAACQPGDGTNTTETSRPEADTAMAAAEAVERQTASAKPLAGAKDDVIAAGARLIAASSYHAVIATDNGTREFTMTVDFVAPDRYRITLPTGTQTLIGQTMHMDMQGRKMSVPVPPGTTDQWRDPGKLEANTAGVHVESLGSDRIDGKGATKYRITHDDPALKPTLLWIGDDGYPLRVEADGEFEGKPSKTTITYSRFDDPSIRVEAP